MTKVIQLVRNRIRLELAFSVAYLLLLTPRPWGREGQITVLLADHTLDWREAGLEVYCPRKPFPVHITCAWHSAGCGVPRSSSR